MFVRIAGIGQNCLHRLEIREIDQYRRKQVRGGAILLQSEDRETQDILADPWLSGGGQPNGIEIFFAHAQAVLRIDRQHRKRQEAERRIFQALQADQRLQVRKLKQQEVSPVFKAQQTVRKSDHRIRLIVDRFE